MPWELLYADDLGLIAETEKELLEKVDVWRIGMESKRLRVNMAKTKIMKCQPKAGLREETGKYPCGVCKKGSVQIQFFVWDVVNGFTRNVASVLENLKKILTSDVECV